MSILEQEVWTALIFCIVVLMSIIVVQDFDIAKLKREIKELVRDVR